MSSEEPPDPLVGTVVDGRYRVIARLSEGGMGVVYRAEHVFLKREVALKRLHPELTGHGQAVARFEREAQAAARIQHPNVCTVLDLGLGDDGAFHIAMELLDGTPLDARIAQAAPLPLAEVADIGVQICDALDAAHALGIVHRDLKPENVMLVARRGGRGWTAKIMDFGIAKVVQEADGRKLTQAGMVFGTPQYMAPEQAAGEAVDARADIYALGVILYEMATRRPPFEAPNVATLLIKHMTEPPPPLEVAAPFLSFPEPFCALVLRCLQKRPDDRFASAVDLAAALRPVAGMEALSVTPPPPSPADRPMLPTLLAGTGELPASRPAPTATAFPFAPAPTARPAPRTRHLPIALAAVGAAALVVFTTVLALRDDGDSPEPAARTAADAGSRPDAASASPESLPAPEPSSLRQALAATAVPPDPDPPPADPGPPSIVERLLDPQARLEAARREFDARPEIVEALALHADGRTADAIARLEWLGDRLGEIAHYHYALALLYEKDRRIPKALERATRAVELEPAYASAPDLLAMAERGIAQSASAEAAEAFLERALDLPAARRLVERAFEENRSSAVMRRVADLLGRRGLIDGLPEYLRMPLQVVAARNCPKRKEVLALIRNRPDPRMAPYLRRLRSDSGCGLFNRQDCYSCERSAIRAALAAVAAASSEPRDGAP